MNSLVKKLLRASSSSHMYLFVAGTVAMSVVSICSSDKFSLNRNTFSLFSTSVGHDNPMTNVKEYDYVVIGGGSGGMASAKEAAALGAKVCLFDFVKPSPQGTSWGLGGTCVNVGCVPKKLMHNAGLMGAILHHDAETVGWTAKGAAKTINWEKLSTYVTGYVRSLNFQYKNSLRSAHVEYINAFASLKDPHTITYKLKGENHEIKGKHILVCPGGRPYIPTEIPGAVEYAITSDDIFWRKEAPGKTLVVGASYIALECAGFLTELGYDVSVAVRSMLLRGFDQQSANKVGTYMAEIGTKFLHKHEVERIEKVEDGSLRVTLVDGATQKRVTDKFNTVLFATGRSAAVNDLHLHKMGVKLHKSSYGDKIATDDHDRTSINHMYAIGDAAHDRPELTPVAIKAGRMLAKRLFGKSTSLMNYALVPTSVFTPMEYSCVGLSEEAAIEKHKSENVEVYLSEFMPLTLSSLHREKVVGTREHEFDASLSPTCLVKLVCLKSKESSPEHNMDKVIGFHFVGPNAGEICQGVAIAMKRNATKQDFDDTVGIHPTDAESFCDLQITKSSGEDWVSSGGCGGGKCG